MFNPFSGNMSLNGIFSKKCAIKNCTVLLRTFQVNVESICSGKTSEMSNPICQTFKTTKMNLLKVVFGKNINVKYCTFKYYCIHISVDSVTQRLLKPRYIYFIFVAVFSMEIGLFIRSAPDNYFVYSQDSTWVSYEQAKTVSRTFSFSRKYSIVVVEMHVYLKSLITLTPYQRSCWLQGQSSQSCFGLFIRGPGRIFLMGRKSCDTVSFYMYGICRVQMPTKFSSTTTIVFWVCFCWNNTVWVPISSS